MKIILPKKLRLFQHLLAVAVVIFSYHNARAQSCTPPATNMVSWWRAEGDATDAAGGNNGGGNYGFVPGEVGQAFDMDGDTTYAYVGSPANLQLQNFTIECWIKRYSSSSSSLVTADAELLAYGQGGYGFGVLNNGSLFLESIGVNSVQVSTALTDTTSFHHVAVTKSGSTVIFYLDGVAYAASAYATTFTFNTGVAIGARGDTLNNNFYGAIDEMTIYSNALSTSQIQAIYNAGSQGKCVSGPPQIVLSPVNSVVGTGSNDTLTVGASGSLPLSYQWSFAGANLPLATNASLMLANLQAAQSGTYAVIVSNQYGTASASANITVELIQPSILTEPGANLQEDVGGYATFSVNATGSLPLTYQWWFNSSVLSGATNPAITLTNLQLSQAGSYLVVVSNAAGTIQSSSGNLIVNQGPGCVMVPPNMVSWWAAEGNGLDQYGGNNGTLTNITFGEGEVGEGFIFNTTNSFVNLGNPSSLQLQNFTIEAWVQRYSSSEVSLTAPNAEILCYGVGGYGFGMWSDGRLYLTKAGVDNLAVSVGFTDTSTFHHLALTKNGTSVIFYFDGVAYPGASAYTSTFVFTSPIAIGTDGTFNQSFYGMIDELAIYNRALSASEIQGIYNAGSGGKCVSGPPVIAIPPTNTVVQVGSSAAFNAGVSGTLLSYQWSFKGTNLPGATNSLLTLTNLQLTQSGNYTLLVSNQFGTATTSAFLTVQYIPPSITSQPASNVMAFVNMTASFSVVASGTAPLSYQWWFNSKVISGATNPSLTLTNLQSNQGGAYFVVVSNAGGTIPSANAILTINQDPPCVIPPPNLVSWWAAEGNGIDQYGGNNGTVTNIGYGQGEVGQGFILTNGNSYVDLGNPANLQLQNFTIETWVQRYSSTAVTLNGTPNAEIFCYGTGGYGLGVWSDGRLFLTDANVNDVAVSVGFTDTNTLHHIAVTKNGTNVICYFDGVAYAIAGAYTSIFTFTTSLAIGEVGGSHASAFYGMIDELAVYSRALSASEIQSIYNAGFGGKCLTAPIITSQPSNSITGPGSTVVFQVSATGPYMNYQWYLNGGVISGATNSALTLTNVSALQAGNYSVFLSNYLGTAVSTNASLGVQFATAYVNGAKVTNSPASYSGPVTLQLTNFYSGGYIFYTLDGSTPTPYSSIYAGPIALSNSVVLQTLVFSVDFTSFGYSSPVSLFIQPAYVLTTITAGGGMITRSLTNSFFTSNTLITLTAAPSNGWTFLEWQGDVFGTTPTASLLITRNQSVQAVFGTTVTKSTGGNGSVGFNPPGSVFPYGFNLQASAIPQPGNVFVLWGNAASGSTNPLSFLVTNPNPELSALFTTLGSGQVALSVVPVGHGQVSVNPPANGYTSGSSVTIMATPNAGKFFLGWSGSASGKQNPLTVVMNQSKTIYANFTTNYSLSIATPPGGASQGVDLSLIGEIGTHYRLDTSTNLVNWTPLFNLTNGVGTLNYMDTNTFNLSRKFYQSVILP